MKEGVLVPEEVTSIPKEPTRLKEYERDFGNHELESMLDDLVAQEFSGIKSIEHVSHFDDQETHIDRCIETNDGVRFVPDYTGTLNKKTMEEKARQFLKAPVVHLHDDKGKEVAGAEVLKLVLPVDIIEYGKAYSRFLEAGSGKPIDYLDDPSGEALRIAARAVYQIDQLIKTKKELKAPKEEIDKIQQFAGPVRAFWLARRDELRTKRYPRRAA